MKHLPRILLALLLGGIAGCPSPETSGSTFETENSIAFVVKNSDGLPQAKSSVTIHPKNFLNWPGAKEENAYFETDSLGILRIDSLPEGDYSVLAQTGNLAETQKGFCQFSVPKVLPDSGLSIVVETAAPATLYGKFLSEKSPVWIFIPGSDYATLVDSNGNFEFAYLPRGALEWIAIYSADSEKVVLGEGRFEIWEDSANVSFKDTASKKGLFEDFENGIGSWYRSVSEFAAATLELDSSGSGREGVVAHFASQVDSVSNWALMGRFLGGAVDMSDLDSAVFWAKGRTGSKLSFAFDVLADSTDPYTSGKAWEHFELDTLWTRYSVSPKTLLAADSIGGNIGWDAVKENVTNISIFGGSNSEFWIDEISFYGIDFEIGI